MALIISPEDQQHVNQLRMDLAQAVIDIAEVRPNLADTASRDNKEKAIEGLRMVRRRLDQLGMVFTRAERPNNG